MKPERFKTLDIFRGLASLLIVCLHILAVAFEPTSPATSVLYRFRIGTDIFFVLSGFGVGIAAHRIVHERRSIGRFLAKRFKKIYTVFFYSLILTAIALPLTFTVLGYLRQGYVHSYFNDFSLLHWLKILTLSQVFSAEGWALNKAFLPLNGVYWFVAVLLQMYIVVGISLLLKRNYYKLLVPITFLSLLCLHPTFKEFIPYGLFLPKWCEFAAGMILFHAIRKYPSPGRLHYFVLVVTTAILALISMLTPLPYDVYRFLSAVFLACFFWVLYPLDNWCATQPVFYPLRFMGRFSFSTYLLHMPLWPFAEMVSRYIFPFSQPWSSIFVIIPTILLMSYLWHLFFERPETVRQVVYALCHPWQNLRDHIKQDWVEFSSPPPIKAPPQQPLPAIVDQEQTEPSS